MFSFGTMKTNKVEKNLKRNLRKLNQGKLWNVTGTFLVVSTYCSIPARKKGKLEGRKLGLWLDNLNYLEGKKRWWQGENKYVNIEVEILRKSIKERIIFSLLSCNKIISLINEFFFCLRCQDSIKSHCIGENSSIFHRFQLFCLC